MQADRVQVQGDKVVVIGAGIGGLVGALLLAAHGLDVTVLERAAAPGGKMREVEVAGQKLDAGPTVCTMRPVFEQIFAEAGANLADHVCLTPLSLLARHAWDEGRGIDLFADRQQSAGAIGDFAGAGAARQYLAFCARSRDMFETLNMSFMQVERPSQLGLVARAGLAATWRTSPFSSLWRALGRSFDDPRLRQLFARYATYCGSSPFAAPATLMLVAHVEQDGVWAVEGGMHRLAQALAVLCEVKGVRFRFNADVAEIQVAQARVSGVQLACGEGVPADAVILNGDAQALTAGLFGAEAKAAIPAQKRRNRSLSALTWHMVAKPSGFDLARHNVFFSHDYRAEFDAVFGQGRVPDDPTVYVCAHDRDGDQAMPDGPERLLVLVNAPPCGDERSFDEAEQKTCTTNMSRTLARCGLSLDASQGATQLVTPVDFNRLFPATGGALYGRTTHGAMASFARPGSRTSLPGLYLAGGSVHPGPGVPMVALSGRLAARAVIADRMAHSVSTGLSRTGATAGGMSTRSAMTGNSG